MPTNGTKFDDTLIGGIAAEAIASGAGNDSVDGGDGGDTISGGAGNDTLDGGDGADEVHGDAGNDWLDGGLGDDTLAGGNGSDTLLGGDGADALQGGIGADSLSGGSGDDTLAGGGGGDALDGGAGNDLLSGGAGPDWVTAGDGNDTVAAGGGSDAIDGGDGDDLLTAGAGDDVANGGSGSDTIYGGDGDDLVAGGGDADVLFGGRGADLYVHQVGDGNDTVVNADGLDHVLLAGTDLYDFHWTRDGDDLVIGPAVDADDFEFASGSLRIVGQYAGSGIAYFEIDSIYNNFYGADLDLARIYAPRGMQGGDQGAAAELIQGGDGDDLLVGVAGADGPGGASLSSGFRDQLFGGDGNDTIYGGDNGDLAVFDPLLGYAEVAGDVIRGQDGDDLIFAGGGNDDVRGGPGNDTIWGGDGVDNARYDQSSDPVVVDLAAGTAVRATEIDELHEIENVRGGDGADSITGDGEANSLRGRGGDDTLIGAEGDDTLQGDGGADLYVHNVGDGNDIVINADGLDHVLLADNDLYDFHWAREGDDLIIGPAVDAEDFEFASGSVRIAGQYAGPDAGIAYFEIDSIYNNFYGIDLDLARIYTPNGMQGVDQGAAAELIQGGDGADLILGVAGADGPGGGSLSSGFRDMLWGGAGNDTMHGGDNGDLVVFDPLLGSEEVAGDFIRGEGGDDLIFGGGGDDNILGGPGNDTIWGGDGVDTARYDKSSDPVVVDLGAGTAVRGSETDELHEIENVRGGDGADSITGDGGANSLRGRDGDDTLIGSGGDDGLRGDGGSDRIDGGAGIDALQGDAGDDVFIFAALQADGDAINDFEGAGLAGGDMIEFHGYAPGATLTYQGDDAWLVDDTVTAETITIAGVSSLTEGEDYFFV
jgi:Ca2+-binding RTX toxin-like protein